MSLNPKPPGAFKRFFAKLSRIAEGIRKVFITVAVFGGVAAFSFGIYMGVSQSRGKVEPKSVLVLAPQGEMADELSKSPTSLVSELAGAGGGKGVLLRDWVEALEKAAKDERIERAILLLDDFDGAGLATLREAAAAIETFKASGKPIIAWGAMYDQRRYYLASHASKVYVHPMGEVLIEGVGRQGKHYRDALKRLGVEPNLIKGGAFKSAGEVYANNAPSKEALEADKYLLDAVWGVYMQGIERARKLPEGHITKSIEALPGALTAVKGNISQLALDWKFADEVKTFEDIRKTLMTEVGEDKDGKTFRQTSMDAYVKNVRERVKGEHVAVIVASGEIGDGDAPSGKIGGKSTSRLIRDVVADKNVKAIVLRVDSPGGSAYGSELIRHQLEVARAAGKPVVVSMGDLAASGGYWISMSSDRVIADPATITGSIGVFGLLPSADGAMAKLSIGTGGYKTTWLAGGYDFRQPLDPRVRELVQQGINHIYAEFIGKTATARKLDVAAVDGIAQGRVWTGQQALDRKLVDQVGSLKDAIAAARELAKADAALPFRYRTAKPSSPLAAVLEMLRGQIAAWVGASVADAAQESASLAGLRLTDPVTREVASDLLWLRALVEGRKPYDAVAHCLCEPAL
jgi:protease-4